MTVYFSRLDWPANLATLGELLFALNRAVSLSSRGIKFQVDGLECLPPGFTGYFDSLLREDAGFDRERRLSLARHLAEGVLALV